MNITLSIDEKVVEKARERLRATGKTINQEIREHLEHVAGENQSQLRKDIEFLKSTAGLGNPDGWKWNRDEIYEERLRWPR